MSRLEGRRLQNGRNGIRIGIFQELLEEELLSKGSAHRVRVCVGVCLWNHSRRRGRLGRKEGRMAEGGPLLVGIVSPSAAMFGPAR